MLSSEQWPGGVLDGQVETTEKAVPSRGNSQWKVTGKKEAGRTGEGTGGGAASGLVNGAGSGGRERGDDSA